MGPARFVLALVALLALHGVASAARTQQEQQLAIRAETAGREESVNHLNTYYFDASKPQIALSSRGSPRAGRTGLTVSLPGSSSVSTFMPVVSPQADGMTHSVSRTWSALKNLATMFAKADAINRQIPSSPRLFPRAVVAVTAASDNVPVHMDVSKIIALAEAKGQRSNWANANPSSVLLLPFGQSTGAVADVMGVAYDPKADAVTLELDIVHDPHTISEFEPHPKQTLKVDEAHYHFDTAPGVKVDAQALLDNLKASNFALEGAHLFIKGKSCFGCVTACYTSTLTTDKETASVGESVTVTLTITGLGCGCDSDACSLQECCFLTQDDWSCCVEEYECLKCEGTCASSPCDNTEGQFFTCCPAYFYDDADRCCDNTEECNDCLSPPSKQQNRTGNHWPHTTVGTHRPHNKAGAGNHAKVAAPTKPKQTPKQGAPKSPGSNKRVGNFNDTYVELTLVGDAVWNGETEPTRAGAKAPAGKQGPAKAPAGKKLTAKVPRGAEARQLPSKLIVSGETDANDSFEASFTVTGPGPIYVLLTYIDFGTPAEPSLAAINFGGVSVPVDKLALVPKKAHRHLHDPIELSAIAQDASNSPVVGASVGFKVYGDCDPTADVSSATTGAGGVAHVNVVCSRPGQAWVVAAGVDTAGAPVLSEPAHIIYTHGGYDSYPGKGHEGYYHDNGYGYDRGYGRDDRYHHPY